MLYLKHLQVCNIEFASNAFGTLARFLLAKISNKIDYISDLEADSQRQWSVDCWYKVDQWLYRKPIIWAAIIATT